MVGSVMRSLIAGTPSSAKVSGLDLLVTIRLAAIHCLGGSFLPVDGMPSRILTSDRGQGPQPRSGPPTAAALRVTAGQGTMQRPSGGHRTSDSGRHVKFRRPTHIKHLWLSNRMVSSVINRHEQRVFLPVPWFSPRSRHRSPHHGVRKLRGLNVTGAVRFDRTGRHGITRNHPRLRPGKGQGDRWINNGSWRWSWRSSGCRLALGCFT